MTDKRPIVPRPEAGSTDRELTEPLREDIRLLGGILGQIVRKHAGEATFELVEKARVESFRIRRDEICLLYTSPSPRD